MDTVQKIILAAIEIVNADGTEALTTRRIAEDAGVNTAAVNYHFGSKENLISQVLELTLTHLFSDMDMIISVDSLTAPERVFYLIDYMIEGISRYPGLTRSYMFDPAVSGTTRAQFTEHLEGVISRLSATPGMKLAIGQAISSAISAALIPEVFSMLTGGAISSEAARRSYILPLVNRIPGIELEVTLPFLEKIEAIREKAFRE